MVLILFNNMLRDNKFGMVFRVGVGATFSTIDALTDIYVVSTYYNNEDLHVQAVAMLSMIVGNMFLQFLVVLTQYKTKSWSRKMGELLLTLCFLRPAVDAYRVSLNHESENVTFNALTEVS